jgi:PKD repeat protein
MKKQTTFINTVTALIVVLVMCSQSHAQLIRYDFSSGATTTNSGTEGSTADLTFGVNVTFGAASNTVTATAMGDAVTFDGTSASSTTTGTVANLPQGDAARTVTAWVKNPADTGNRAIVSWGNTASTQNFTFGFNSTGKVLLQINGAYRSTPTEIKDNTWHHVAVTYPAAGTMSDTKIYIDGIEITSLNGGGTTVPNTVGTTLYLGSELGVGEYSAATIDDVRIYDSVLDAAAIATIANIAVAAPVADFSVDNTTPTVGEIVTFTDSSTNTPTSWTWDFGDATAVGDETLQNPQVAFQTEGTYAITLTATNAGGSSAPETKSGYITVGAGTVGSGDLQARYNFDGDITDASSYGRDLTATGAFVPSYEDDADANATNALTTSGVFADHLITSYPGVSGSNSRTVTAWFKTAATGVTREPIVSWGADNGGEMFNVMVSPQNTGAIRIEGGTSSVLSTITGLNDDAWHHVAVTFDTTGNHQLNSCLIYVDGVLTPTLDGFNSSQVINTDGVTNFLRIGSAVYNTYAFDGALDDIRIYSKVLSASEVTEVYNRQTLDNKEFTLADAAIKIYPNPVQDILTIDARVNEIFNVSVYSILGKKVTTKVISDANGQTVLDVSGLASGMYTVVVSLSSYSTSFKVVKK